MYLLTSDEPFFNAQTSISDSNCKIKIHYIFEKCPVSLNNVELDFKRTDLTEEEVGAFKNEFSKKYNLTFDTK